MSDDRGAFGKGIQRFRTGGLAIGVLPLVLGFALLLAGERVPALEMLVVTVILIFLVLWAARCAEEVVENLLAGRQDRK